MVDAILLGRQRINRISIYQTLQHKLWSWNTEFVQFFSKFLSNFCCCAVGHSCFLYKKLSNFFFLKISTKLLVIGQLGSHVFSIFLKIFTKPFVVVQLGSHVFSIFLKISTKLLVVVQLATHVWEESLSLLDLPPSHILLFKQQPQFVSNLTF